MSQGLRERKKARTRRELSAAAVNLFYKRGFDAVTIEEIADAAMVSPRTVQRYFRTKADIVFASHADNVALFRDTIEHELATGGGLADALCAAGLAVAKMSLAEDHAVQKQILLDREPELRARWLQNGQEFRDIIGGLVARESGLSEDDFNVRIAAGAIHGALRAAWWAALSSWANSDDASDLDSIFTKTKDVMECGIQRLMTKGQPAAGSAGAFC